VTRREEMEAAGEDIVLPDCAAPFIVAELLEIGPVLSGSMGMSAIGWRDIEAWQSCMGVELAPWRSRLLVELSREYASFSQKAEKADCPAPWVEVMTEDRREKIARSLKIGLEALIMVRGK
jgi:hypothetical protein